MQGKIQKIPVPPPPQPRIWTSLDLIKWTTEFFTKKGIASPRLEAEILLAEVLGCPRIRLYVDFEKPVPAEKLAQYREFVRRRAETREPLQYILGHTEFIDLKLKVSPAVLIPRPETELLALWSVERLKEAAGESLRALDLCTGSGCLALYAAWKETRAKVIATDISEAALTLATENAAKLNLSERVSFRRGDLFEALQPEEKNSFDILISNPPYIDPAEEPKLQPEVRDHEPKSALFAGENGLAIVRMIIAGGAAWLKPGGWLGMEFGFGQAEAMRKLAEDAGTWEQIEIRVDSAKIPRMLLAKKLQPNSQH